MILLTDLTLLEVGHYLVEGATGIAVLYLAFSKSYFQEKGKNLATKEDIGEITKTVEAIKTELSFKGQLKFSVKTEERNALIDCYSKYHLWLRLLMNFTIRGDFDDTENIIYKDQLSLEQAYFDFVITKAKVDLYILEETGITNILSNLELSTLVLHHETNNFVLHFDSLKKLYEIEQQSGIPQDAKLISIKKFGNERNKLFADYSTKRIDLYRDILLKSTEFKSICYDLLIKLNEN